MITAENLTKRYGATTAVNDLSFTVRPGAVTGFLGRNGAGKSTTMRMLVGLDRPTAGRISIDGKDYREFNDPLRHLGAMLDARGVHPGRSGYDHLLAVAYSNGIPRRRVEHVVEMVGLRSVVFRRAGGFSLGMGQRLGIATALLGDPEILVLDEPTNGLDPDGILWLRTLLSRIATEGRTVFLSSHLMSELALIAEDLVVIGGGELLAVGSVEAVVASVSPETVRVITPEAGALARALQGPGVSVSSTDSESLDVRGLAAREIGSIAAGARIVLYGLETHRASLEEAFMQITQGAPVHGAHLQEAAE